MFVKARRSNVDDSEFVLVEETCDDPKLNQGQSMLQALSLARKRSNDRRPLRCFALYIHHFMCFVSQICVFLFTRL